ncbi:hypothetical protein P3T37_003977 [Kitasatospora sp. MAA4]|uniref:helix-turn-helix domain-containing protein n=1 Tax=Kitasatospora sp. MAA4 TaxID=3035093 RepID=UPI00247689C4|nr:helix-turn-helix transcriptional regulator [Kitasatospora sp. MAA4]MDH6134573.1 hypothetical protein [Kitasatospora sp. MAA4]
MGRKQRDLDISGGPAAEFAAELRQARQAAGNPTFATMSRRAHRSISALAEAAGGVEFPTWATVEAFVHACGHTETAAWRARWEQAQDAVARSAPTLPPPIEAVTPQTTTPQTVEPTAPDHLTPRWPQRLLTRLRTVAVLVLGLAIGIPVGAGLHQSPTRGSAATVPHPMPSVVVVPAPSPVPWPPAGSGCQARTQWIYQYPQAFTGQVYVLLSTPGPWPSGTAATLTWGQWAWRHSVTVQPGDPAQTAGGTLLLFSKLDASARNPLVQFDSSTPVCAAFGTAGGTSVAPLATVDANEGWVSSTPSPAPAG